MNKTIKKLSMLMAVMAVSIVFVACSDDDKYSISKAEIARKLRLTLAAPRQASFHPAAASRPSTS